MSSPLAPQPIGADDDFPPVQLKPSVVKASVATKSTGSGNKVATNESNSNNNNSSTVSAVKVVRTGDGTSECGALLRALETRGDKERPFTVNKVLPGEIPRLTVTMPDLNRHLNDLLFRDNDAVLYRCLRKPDGAAAADERYLLCSSNPHAPVADLTVLLCTVAMKPMLNTEPMSATHLQCVRITIPCQLQAASRQQWRAYPPLPSNADKVDKTSKETGAGRQRLSHATLPCVVLGQVPFAMTAEQVHAILTEAGVQPQSIERVDNGPLLRVFLSDFREVVRATALNQTIIITGAGALIGHTKRDDPAVAASTRAAMVAMCLVSDRVFREWTLKNEPIITRLGEEEQRYLEEDPFAANANRKYLGDMIRKAQTGKRIGLMPMTIEHAEISFVEGRMFRQLFAEVEFETAWEAVESFHVRGAGGVGVAGSTPEEDEAARYQYGECMDLVRGLARSISAGDPVKDTTLQTQLDRLRALRERKPGTVVDSKGAVSNIGDTAIVSGSAQPVAKQVSMAAAASTSVGGGPPPRATSTSVGGPPPPATSSASAAGLNPSAAPIDRNFGNSAAAQRGGKQRGGGPAATFQGKAPPAYQVPARQPPAAAAANTHTTKTVGSTTNAPYRAGGPSNQQQQHHQRQGAPGTLPLKPPPQQQAPSSASGGGGFPAGTVLLPLGSDATRPALSTPTAAAHEDPIGLGGRQASSPAPATTSPFSAADWTFDVTSGGDGGSTTTGSVWGGATF